jgi:hypothetical protein
MPKCSTIKYTLMPYALTEMDLTILKHILRDRRKSFTQIQEKQEHAPSVKSKYDKFVEIGFNLS